VKIDLQLEDKYLDSFNQLVEERNEDPSALVSKLVKSRIDEIDGVNADIRKFREYLDAHPRGKSLFWLYTWNLRRRLQWSEDRLENVECVLMLRRSVDNLDD
jgi:hypothetical protein